MQEGSGKEMWFSFSTSRNKKATRVNILLSVYKRDKKKEQRANDIFLENIHSVKYKRSKRIQRDRWRMRTALYMETGANTFQGRISKFRQKRMGNKKVPWFNSEKSIGDLLEWSSQQVKLLLSIFLQQSFFLFSLALALSSVALCSCHVWAMINLTKRCQQTPAE